MPDEQKYQPGKVHVDLDAAANIIRKVIPDAFGPGDRGAVSVPILLSVA
jgi:hypothetical protein